MVTDERVVVGFSERLLPLTAEEERIEASGAELRVMGLWTEEAIRSTASAADILIVGATEPITAGVLADLRRLRLVVRRGVGVDNVDVAAATELGIPVAFTPDASVEEVSDHALALLLALERRIPLLNRAVHEGRWQRGSQEIVLIRAPARRLSSLTLGLVGLGRIGRALARKAGGVVSRTIAFDPYVSASGGHAPEGIELVEFDRLLAESDLISIHAPSNPRTQGLFGSEAFSKVRPGALLVNTSRGALVDEEALIAALEDGRLAGAGLDVTEHEPIPAGHPLLSRDDVILTAHSAASSIEASSALRRSSVDAVLQALRNDRPVAVVDPSVFDQPNCRLRVGET